MDRRRMCCGLALMLVAMVGCGSAGEPRGYVSGKVTYSGEPVSEGVVVFSSATGNFAAQGTLQNNGSYSVRSSDGGLPVGEYQVVVLPPTVQTPDTPDSPGGEAFLEVDNIPSRYRSASQSGLSLKVEAGNNTFDIAMQPEG